MKNQLTLITTGLLALTILFACTPQESPKSDPATLKSEIQEMENRWAEAYNAGDADALLALYADDATGMSNEKPLVTGKENLRKAFNEEMATRNTDNKFTFTTLSVAGDENMLVETGMTTLTYPDGRTEDAGKYMAVWKKQGDKWVCTHDMSNNNNKPTGPVGYKSVHLLDLPKGVEEAELADALARLNAAIKGQGYPGAGYFLYKAGDDVDSYRYYFEGAWPSKAAYEAIHASDAWKAEAENLSDLSAKLRDKEIYRKVELMKK